MAGTATYTFHSCLGRGGFGEVYLATQRSGSGLERRVAVKVLKLGLKDQNTAVKRLRDEGRLLALLDHPAILGVHEMTRIRGRIALVTQYVEGTDLSRCCRAGHMLPPRVALSVLAEVAGALHTAWTTESPETGKPLRLVHRDIKPENIRLSRHGEVKLLDFGIARSHEVSREARTAMGDIPFTPGYAAPEAFLDGVQDGPTDVFALGATLYRVLVGERFYEGVKLQEQVSISANRARYIRYLAGRLQHVPDDVHPDLVPLLREMLSWNPDERPSAEQIQTRAEAMADEIPGPTPKRWARAAELPEPPRVEGAALTGLEVAEDGDESVVFSTKSRWDATTERLPSPDTPPPPTPPPPPPVGLDSMKPVTMEGSMDDLMSEEALARSRDPGTAPVDGPGPLGLLVRVAVALLVAAVFFGILAVAGVALGLWAGS